MRASAAEIKTQLTAFEGEIVRSREEVASVLDYFGEDPKRSPADFFTTLASFCSVRRFWCAQSSRMAIAHGCGSWWQAFEGARKEVDVEDEAALRAERMKQRRLTVSKPPSSGADQGRSGVGALFRRQQRDRSSSDRSLGSPQSLAD